MILINSNKTMRCFGFVALILESKKLLIIILPIFFSLSYGETSSLQSSKYSSRVVSLLDQCSKLTQFTVFKY